MHLPVFCSLLVLTLLTGCGANTFDRDVAGRTVAMGFVEVRQSLKGERVVDLKATQRLPMFDDWSPDIEERLSAIAASDGQLTLAMQLACMALLRDAGVAPRQARHAG
jgi:hypothetical protein